jgi:CubicO group peptidase (beta-lactamase class C family)
MTNPTHVGDLNLFSGLPQYQNFARFKELLPTSRMQAAATPKPFATGLEAALPSSYPFAGAQRSSEQFLADTHTAALLVLREGSIRLERYQLSGGEEVQWISWSVAKSVVSALVGIALAEGDIRSLEDPISDYISVDPGSAYDGVRINDVLQMSSGARWNEDYNDSSSDVHRLAAAMAGATTLESFVATMMREAPPGSVCRYNSGDTQALGILLVCATGRSLTDYMRDKLVEPLGFESDSYWLVDAAGMEMAFAGLNLTARDFAKFGELYRNRGNWHGKQIVPAEWVRDSVRADAPHLLPGAPRLADHAIDLGYGYQWWLPSGNRGDYSAIGIYNQLVYVDPSRSVTIVKLSANPAYGTSTGEATNRELENIAFVQAISASLG